LLSPIKATQSSACLLIILVGYVLCLGSAFKKFLFSRIMTKTMEHSQTSEASNLILYKLKLHYIFRNACHGKP
jgi:hypothetical protein